MYNPYGEVARPESDGGANGGGRRAGAGEILYAGYRADREMGLHQARFRFYHPTLGRWVSRDPIGYADGLALYQYVASAPTTNGDPQGLNAVIPEHSDTLKLPPPQYMDTPEPINLREQTTVRLEVETLAAGGSIELGANGPQVAMTDPGLLLTLGHAFNRWWYGVDADISFWEDRSSTAFSATLSVSVSADRPTPWQICPAYTWRLTVYNVCCTSGKVRVRTDSEQQPGAKAVVPDAGVFPLPVGGEPLRLSPDVKLEIIQSFEEKGRGLRRKFESSGRVIVHVMCVE